MVMFCWLVSSLRRFGLLPVEVASVVAGKLKMLSVWAGLCTDSESKVMPGILPGGRVWSGLRRAGSKGSKSCSLPSPPSFIKTSIKSGPVETDCTVS